MQVKHGFQVWTFLEKMSTETSFELSFDLIDDLSISSLTDDERVNILERHLLKINSAAQCVLDLPSGENFN